LPVESPAVECQYQAHHTGKVLRQVLYKVGRIAHREIVQEQFIVVTISYKCIGVHRKLAVSEKTLNRKLGDVSLVIPSELPLAPLQ
jgi:hypothetical protein